MSVANKLTTSMVRALLISIVSILACQTAYAQLPSQIDLQRPGDREFVLDTADMINDADEQKIKQIADKLLTDKAAPIVVVTIESMGKHGGEGLRIETFARLLFDQWGIGPATLGETPWNYGILLLVSQQDRKARIELGAGWRREKDATAQQIMDEMIIPEFKQGNFSGGIVAGVEALDKMARDLELPTRPRPTWHYVVGAIFAGLLVFTVVSLIRRGASGWAWLFWGALFGLVGFVLYQMVTSRSSGGGGGYSGGSFGGGFSGGGGATGSW
ncbi:MAG: TPM domain-containing protein [Pirellulales bacterium]